MFSQNAMTLLTTSASGTNQITREKEEELQYLKTDLSTKDFGKPINDQAKAASSVPQEKYIKAIGKTIVQTAMEYSITDLALKLKAGGRKHNLMEKDSKL